MHKIHIEIFSARAIHKYVLCCLVFLLLSDWKPAIPPILNYYKKSLYYLLELEGICDQSAIHWMLLHALVTMENEKWDQNRFLNHSIIFVSNLTTILFCRKVICFTPTKTILKRNRWSEWHNVKCAHINNFVHFIKDAWHDKIQT